MNKTAQSRREPGRGKGQKRRGVSRKTVSVVRLTCTKGYVAATPGSAGKCPSIKKRKKYVNEIK